MGETHLLVESNGHNLGEQTSEAGARRVGWTEEEILVISAMLRKELRDLGVHTYWPL